MIFLFGLILQRAKEKMKSKISCFFLHSIEKKKMSDDRAPPAAPPAGGVCPFRGVMQRVGLSPRDPADAKEGNAATPPGVCPFSGAKSGGGDASMASEPSTSTAPGSGGGGVCPLGFGRSKPGGPPLSRLHCPRCKSLFHDCVLLGCGHRFCASCLGGKATDCCLVCGADVSSRLPDAESQALADAALEDAARADREGQAQAWLRAAMSSAAGGNHAAALARAERAAAALEEELLASCPSSSSASSSHSPSSAAARRAAVSGVIGDSHRSLGDLEAAAVRYEGAVAVLEGALAEASKVGEGGGGGEKRGDGEGGNPPSDPSSSSASASPPSSSSSSLRELTRALTVTLNKLGDLRYSSASATEARPLYARALRERLAAAGVGEEQAARAASSGSGSSASPSPSSAAIPPASEGDAERASDLIDAGLSAAKVADADAAAAGEGGGEEGAALAEAAERGLRLAAALLAAGAAGAAAAGGPLAARAERRRAFLESSNGQGK